MEVANLLDAANGLFPFQPINRCLDRRVSRPALFRKALLNLADGRLAPRPQGLHDLQLQLRQLGLGHLISYQRMQYYYMCSFRVKNILISLPPFAQVVVTFVTDFLVPLRLRYPVSPVSLRADEHQEVSPCMGEVAGPCS